MKRADTRDLDAATGPSCRPKGRAPAAALTRTGEAHATFFDWIEVFHNEVRHHGTVDPVS